jgi:hypothetical protein
LSACKKKEDPAKATPLTELRVSLVKSDLTKPDPNADFWQDVPASEVTLIAQPMVAPRPEQTTTERVFVQAVHDGKTAAFRLRWQDSEKSEAGRLGEFSDAFALQFPLNDGTVPPVMMGAKDLPVHIFHWRAQYQRDEEQGKPTMKDLYPHGSIDIYPMEFKDAKGGTPEQREQFSPGQAEGNPQSYVKNGVDEIVAEGFSTSAVMQGHGSKAHGEWKDGWWTLVIARPMAIEGGSRLASGSVSQIAFAAWQGGKGEVGSRKSIIMAWTPVKVEG